MQRHSNFYLNGIGLFREPWRKWQPQRMRELTHLFLDIGGEGPHHLALTTLHAHCFLCLTFSTSVLTSSFSLLIHFLKGFQCLESLNLKSLSSYPEILKKTQDRLLQKNKTHFFPVSTPSSSCTPALIRWAEPLMNVEFLPTLVWSFSPKT